MNQFTDIDRAPSSTPAPAARLQRHLLIAGTGRAGTSFLVKYLGELGLDTHLSKHGAHAYWDTDAHAGLEDMPLVGDATTLPYVVKSPYAYQFIDAMLARSDIALDGVIIPVRDLNEAASSRALTEIQHLHRAVPWLPELDETWEQWALTPGGVVYSLNVLDQARLLAMGFHHLVQRLVRARVPIGFVHFPSMVTDADYLFRQMQPFLPGIDIEAARKAHAAIANPAEVRVGDELKSAGSQDPATLEEVPAPSLEAIALRRQSGQLREELQRLLRAEDLLKAETASQSARNISELGKLSEDLSRRSEELRALDTALARARMKIEKDRKQADVLQEELAQVESELAALHGSSEWRFTMPLRAVTRALQAFFR